ncbi:hypothetical protein KUV80_11145 [Fictibacillus nanhaiensis]|uniref:hypothetical protein n=1 Tax=Fictibacillus nanhaiensis TaxID=742169 RepID=UPI001C94F6E0|nr:hypothetical protein [Fictibacillus nanhaiensis]MBY6037215.1 hypothetical protein [Fictibacillus nanhaiensis]
MYILPSGSSIHSDYDFNNHRYLMVEIEVVCVKEKLTVYSGYIEDFNEKLVVVNGKAFIRNHYLFVSKS